MVGRLEGRKVVRNELTDKLKTKIDNHWEKTMKSKKVWIGLIALVTLVAAGYIFQADILSLISGLIGPIPVPFLGQGSTASAQTPEGFDPENIPTTAIRPASEAAGVSAAGNIELSSQRPVVLEVAGLVTQVAVEVGDQVAVDDLLLTLDATDLERAVAQNLDVPGAHQIVPGLFEWFDYTDLEASLAPRPLLFTEGGRANQIAQIRQAYALHGAAEALQVYHYEKYRDPESRPLDGVEMPIGITMEQYFAYANVDAAQHRFRPTRAVPWLAKVFGI